MDAWMDLFDREPPAETEATGLAGNRAVRAKAGGRRGGPRAPLADRMRPLTFDEVVGQDHLVGPGRPFRLAIEAGEIPSLVFWGPPGSGKTTLARIIATVTRMRFVAYSAVTSGVAEIRQVIASARDAVRAGAGAGASGTILFVDEIHRFNKAQQDAFLPHVESGLITLIGATTENPSFEINSALLSRLQVVVLERLTSDSIQLLLERALTDSERGIGGQGVMVEEGALGTIAALADGDGRAALNLLEGCAAVAARRGKPPVVNAALAEEVLSKKALRHDRAGDQHYDLISALIKSVRGSDADAGLYWLARLLAGGEDPLFVARRLVILAAEDIGNADPEALRIAVAAFQGVHAIGMPEARLILAQATTYLAAAPKSNAALASYERAHADAVAHGGLPVPLHIRNAPTPLMKQLGRGRGYRYPHGSSPEDAEGADAQTYLPEELLGRRYYEPSGAGREAEIRRRVEERRRRQAGERGENEEGGLGER
jgi:putative ATPase